MKKTKKTTTKRVSKKRKEHPDQMDMFSISSHIKTRSEEVDRLLSQGWPIIAAIDPSKDPKQEQIDELKEIQKLFFPYLINFKKDFPDAQPHIYTAWECAFVAGYSISKHSEEAIQPYEAFRAWASGFEHRLVVLADKAFKMGYERANKPNQDLTIESLYQNKGQAKKPVNKRYLKQEDAPFVIKIFRGCGNHYYKKHNVTGCYEMTSTLKDAMIFKTLSRAVMIDKRISATIQENRTCKIVRVIDEMENNKR